MSVHLHKYYALHILQTGVELHKNAALDLEWLSMNLRNVSVVLSLACLKTVRWCLRIDFLSSVELGLYLPTHDTSAKVTG